MENVVLPEEVEYYVQQLKKQEVAEIGSNSWLEIHERLVKLNQQAVIEAKNCREEVVKDLLVLNDKINILVHEAYCVFVWRSKVLPKLLSKNLTASFFIYTVLYHEINSISLLEIVLYHENSCESLGDNVIDLIDYTVHGITQLIALMHSGYNEKSKTVSTGKKCPAEDMELVMRQSNDIEFNIGIKSITILSYLSDKLPSLPISAARRMMQTHDLPCLLSEILSLRPYMRRTKGSARGFEKYINDKWVQVTGVEILKINKVEAQAWFCLRQLLFNRATFDNYEINAFRQRELGKCSGMINDAVLDQLPPLAELKQFLCTLSTSGNSGQGLNNLILEQIPEIKTRIENNAEKIGWKTIVKSHKRIFVNMEDSKLMEISKRLNNSYNFEIMLEMEEYDSPKTNLINFCGSCKKEAIKKCSSCEAIYYCSRECQISDWNDHKTICYQIGSKLSNN